MNEKLPPSFRVESPFYPSHPCPPEMFVGRKAEIERVMRAARKVAAGRQENVFLEGEYGIGKTSLAQYLKEALARELKLAGVYCTLGKAQTVDDVGALTAKSLIEAEWLDRGFFDKAKDFLGDVVSETTLLGVKVDLQKIRARGSLITGDLLGVLNRFWLEAKDRGYAGLFVVWDEINGIASDPMLAHLIKDMVDTNAVQGMKVPFLLMLCGTRERRTAIVANHEPVARIFDVALIEPLEQAEVERFFSESFASVGISVDPVAMLLLCMYSQGQPKLMHLIGDEVFDLVEGDSVSSPDVTRAVAKVANDVGRRYVIRDINLSLDNDVQRSIFRKMLRAPVNYRLIPVELVESLSEDERSEWAAFVDKMTDLDILVKRDESSYKFKDAFVHFYLTIKMIEEE